MAFWIVRRDYADTRPERFALPGVEIFKLWLKVEEQPPRMSDWRREMQAQGMLDGELEKRGEVEPRACAQSWPGLRANRAHESAWLSQASRRLGGMWARWEDMERPRDEVATIRDI